MLKTLIILCAAVSVLFATSTSPAAEIESRHALIVFEKDDLLRKFNDEVNLRSLSYLTRNRTNLTVADEVRNKVDIVVERVEKVLEMFPKALKFKVVLLASDNDVARIYKTRYGHNVDYIAFYSSREKTVYISVRDVSLHVLAHEFAHVIVDHYFGVSPSARIHEVLAQFAETHLED